MKNLSLSLALLCSFSIAQAKEIRIWNNIAEFPTKIRINFEDGTESGEIVFAESKIMNLLNEKKIVFSDDKKKKYTLSLPDYNNETLLLSRNCDTTSNNLGNSECPFKATFIVENKEYKHDAKKDIPKAPTDLKIPGGNSSNAPTILLYEAGEEKQYFMGNDLNVEEIIEKTK